MPIRVVLVDDHAHVRRLAAVWLLEDNRFTLIGEAEDGPAAVALIDDLRPDAVLLDLRLPTMSGLEALALIRERSPETVVVVLTADEQAATEAAAADAVFIKGDPLIEVLDTMAELVEARAV